MKYYLIVGEASGDLHASHLMAELQLKDPAAEFRFYGGDLMTQVGGTRVRHYSELAYMGFVPVLLHLPTIFANLRRCKQDILQWQPDVVILIDYPGFNLKIAKFVKAHTRIPVYYYISPKIWAWKEYRIRNIRRDVDELFSILPFEVDFYRGHQYPIHYIGNPTVDEVAGYRAKHTESFADFAGANGLDVHRPVIALLAGSRRQEIKDNLPDMIRAASHFMPDYQLVIAGAPGISPDYYDRYRTADTAIIFEQTYRLLMHAKCALVTSGTATLETALFGVPQVVCYHTPIGKVIAWLRKRVLKVKYISLVNLIADREVVRELVADTMTVDHMLYELGLLLLNDASRQQQLRGYADMTTRLGPTGAPRRAAEEMIECLVRYQSKQ